MVLVYRRQVVVLVVVMLVHPLVRVPLHVLQKEVRHGMAWVTVLAELDFKHCREGAPSS